MNEPVSAANAEHYSWGHVCDGWHLLCSENLSVIEERMPAGSAEERHFHGKLRQFFYVLAGQLTLEVEHHDFVLRAGEGLEIAPGQAHKAMNRSSADARILVTSQPPSHDDRFDA